MKEFRHFGGCESIKDAELVDGNFVVKVDGEKYENLNESKVLETRKIEDGRELSVDVGVGEYQIFRFMDANKSLTNGGTKAKIKIRVIDESSGRILTEDFESDFLSRYNLP